MISPNQIPAALVAAVSSTATTLLQDIAVEKLRDWWKTPPAHRAVQATASRFPEYEGLGAQLVAWLDRPKTTAALNGFRRTADQGSTLVAQLANELEDCGFASAPGMATSLSVVEALFAELTVVLLEEEKSTHSVAVVLQRVEATRSEHREALVELPSKVAEAVSSQLNLPGADVLSDAEALIQQGKAQAALDYLALLESRPAPGKPVDRYKLLATRANALLQLGRHSDAERIYRDALAIRPERANAIANLALSRLYQSQLSDALNLADRAIQIEPNNAQGIRVRSQALGKLGRWDEALAEGAKIPEGWERDYFLGTLHLWKGDITPAIEHLERAHELKPEEPWLTLRLATALLQDAQKQMDGSEVAPWGRLPPALLALLQRSETFLDAAIHLFDARDGTDGLMEALAQRAVLRAYLGKSEASQDFERAVSLRPDDTAVLDRAANYWNSHAQPSRTVSAIEAYGRNHQFDTDLTCHLAQALVLLTRRDEAAALLVPALDGSHDSRIAIAAADLALASDRIEDAESALQMVQEVDRSDWRYAVRLAELQERQGKPEASLETLRTALAQAQPKERWRLHLLLAERLARNGDWPGAVEEYEKVVTPGSPEHMLSRFLATLYNARLMSRFFDELEKIRAARGFLSSVASIEAQVLGVLGRLDESDRIYEQLVQKQPRNAAARLQRAIIAFRKGDGTRALELLPSPSEAADLDWDDGLEVAFLRSWLGDPWKALETGYRVYLQHGQRAEVQLGYVQLLLSVEPLVDNQLHPPSAAVGTWVTVTLDGSSTVHKLVAVGDVPRSALEHLPGDVFSRAVSGKRVGESVVLSDDVFGSKTVEIVAVRHAFVGAFQDILQTFESTFPGEKGLRAFAFRGAEDLPALKRVLASTREQAEALAGNYRTMPMPAAMLAKVRNVSDVEAWYTLIGHVEFHPLPVADGSAEAQVESVRLAETSAAPLVLETTSIVALAELECLEHLAALGRRLIVAQSVVDGFDRERIRLIEQRRRGTQTTIEERNGQLLRSEVRPEQVDKALALHERTLAWLRTPINCTVSGVAPASASTRWSLREILTPASVDSLLLTRENGGVLVSDDLRLRGLGKNEFACDGIASLHVLGALRTKAAISDEVHDAGIARMIGWGYYFVPINDRVLDNALRVDKFGLGPHFRAVADALSDPTSNLVPVINAVALFFKRLKLQHIAALQGSGAITYVLTALWRRGSWDRTEQLLRLRLAGTMALLPIQLQELGQEIDAWKRSRWIV